MNGIPYHLFEVLVDLLYPTCWEHIYLLVKTHIPYIANLHRSTSRKYVHPIPSQSDSVFASAYSLHLNCVHHSANYTSTPHSRSQVDDPPLITLLSSLYGWLTCGSSPNP